MNRWSLKELIPYIVGEASRLGIPLFAPSREAVLACFIGAKLSPYRFRQGNLHGPAWSITQAEIDAALDWLKKTEDARRFDQTELHQSRHRPDAKPWVVCPLNFYSRQSETCEELFYAEAIKRGFPIWDVVQVCQSGLQVQVIKSEAFYELALEMANKATMERMESSRLQAV